MQNKIETTICSNCGAEVRKNKFCSQCGTKLDSRCIKCGSQLAANAKFCYECGNKVGTTDNKVENSINDAVVNNVEHDFIDNVANSNNNVVLNNGSNNTKNLVVDNVISEIKEYKINNEKVIENIAEMKDEDLLAFKLFRLHAKSFGKAGITSWNELVERINNNWSEDQYIEELSMYARKNEYIAMQGIKDDLLQKISLKIQDLLRKNEKIILYKDNSIFSNVGEVGHIITNKRLYILKKRKIRYVDYELIYSMHKLNLGGSWYFNDDVDMDIDDVGCTNEEVGIMLGLMCTYARNCHKQGYKINVY